MPTRRTAALVLLLLTILARPASAARTDVVTLANGDRITGEIIVLDRGQLQFKTDDAGTIVIEWLKLTGVEASRQFEILTADGRHFLGSLERAPAGFIQIGGGAGDTLAIPDVTRIAPIGASFWRKLDGSLDAGFTYTRSSGVAQTTLNGDTVFRRPSFQFQLTGSATVTYQDDESNPKSNQGSIQLSYARYRGERWFLAGAGRMETNESLGLVLRSQLGAVVGYRFVTTNRAQLQVGGGLDGNNEQGVDTEATQNLEGLLTLKSSYYTYEYPKTNFDLTLQYYPSLTEWGRQRLQLNTSFKREIVRNFYVGLNVFDSYDSAPPNPDAAHNDIGIVASVGWSFGR